MPTSINEAISILVGICVLAAAVGAAWIFLKGAYNKQRMEALREDVADLSRRNTNLVAENATFKTENTSLKSEVASLESLVTQRAQVDEVLHILNEHHSESVAAWAAIARAVAGGRNDV